MFSLVDAPILGYRKWKVDANNQVLTGSIKNSTWHPGINLAAGCDDHASPGTNCHCGFNAWFDLNDARRSYSGILGSVAGAGDLEVHAKGFRSREAQIIALLVVDEDEELIDKIAARYGIPVFDSPKDFIEFSESQVPTWKVIAEQNKELADKVMMSGKVIEDGDEIWYQNGLIHRDNDLPAVIRENGTQEWWLNGEQHRSGDRPAVIEWDSMSWIHHGKLHRDGDQPAVVLHQDGVVAKSWLRQGIKHRDLDQPAVVAESVDGKDWARIWFENGKQHRGGDRPAYEDSVGKKEWWSCGEKHRIEGPAVVYPDGAEEYWIDGKKVIEYSAPSTGNTSGNWWKFF